MKIDQILIVDDEPDVVDIIEAFAEQFFPQTKILTASDVPTALEILRNQSVQLIISDYNMPKFNGGHFFLEVKSLNLEVKFCICSARDLAEMPEFKGHAPDGVILKPYIAKGLENLASSLRSHNPDPRPGPSIFRPLRIHLLQSLGVCPVDFYLQLGLDKKIKIFSKNDIFSSNDYEKYTSRNVKFLYYDESDFSIIAPYIEKSFSHVLLDVKISSDEEFISSLSHGLDLINLPILKAEQVEKVKKWINHSVDYFKKSNDKRMGIKLEEMLKEKSPWYGKHIALTSYFCHDLSNVLMLNSEQIFLKLGIAALLHDLKMDEEELERNWVLGKTPKLSSNFKTHPSQAVEELPKLKMDLPDVNKIIQDHHELPDGSGFPRGLKGNQISQLSAIFIISHTMAVICLEPPGPKEYDRKTILQMLPYSFHSISPFKEMLRDYAIS